MAYRRNRQLKIETRDFGIIDVEEENIITFKPRKAPIQLIQFSMFNNQKFCRYTFLYLFRFNAIISPVTANVNSTSCVLGSFLYSFSLIFCQLVL